MTKQQIGAELKRLRTEQGLTQPQVAKASGQSAQHIYAMETGTLNLTLDRLEKVAGALGVAVALIPAEKSMLITEPIEKACFPGCEPLTTEEAEALNRQFSGVDFDSAGWDI